MATLQCQQCRTPLRIDGSLHDLNPASFKLLADAAPALEPKAPDQPQSAAGRERLQHYHDVIQQSGHAFQHKSGSQSGRAVSKTHGPEMSYIMLTDSHLAPESPSGGVNGFPSDRSRTSGGQSDGIGGATSTSTSAERTESAVRLFEILSARSDINHPICSECTEVVLEALQKRQTSVIRERDAYVDFLKQAQADVPTSEEMVQIEQDLERIKQQEKLALQELEALELEKSRLETEIAALDLEAERLDEDEELFWRERNAFTSELKAFQEQRDSLQNQLTHDHSVLEALQRTNVFNDTFCIAHDGFFATINGLRLGRLPDRPVEWAEINAALGQTVLLLLVVSEKLNCRFKEHVLVPVGSTSKIIVEEGKHIQGVATKTKVHELHSSGDLPLGLGGLFQGKFDNALVELLVCLRQLGEHVAKKSEGGHILPYKIDKDKINDVSIRLGYGHEEQWTRALKYFLTCCKFLLAHASHVDDSRQPVR